MPERRPDKQAVAALFTRTSADHDPPAAPLFADFGRRLVDWLGPAPGQRVLDVAAGSGATLLPAAQRIGPTGHVLGIDIAPGMIERLGAAIAAREITNAGAMLADAEDIPLDGGSVDVVICAFGLFFFPVPSRALAESWRVLRPGGVVGISTFSRAGSDSIDSIWQVVARFLPPPPPAEDGSRFHRPRQLRAALAAAGFEDIVIEASPYELVLGDSDALLAWLRSMEFRDYVDRMDGATLDRFLHSIAEQHADSHHGQGVRLRMDALFTRAVKP